MGRYLAAGIPANIRVYSEEEGFDKKRLKKLQRKLAKYVCLDIYDCLDLDNGYKYTLKKEAFTKENIYKALKEFEKVTDAPISFYSIYDENIKDMLSDKFKIEMVDDYEKYHSSYGGFLINGEFSVFNKGCYEEDYLLWDCGLDNFGGYDAHISIDYIVIYVDDSKIDSEDESVLLSILNRFKIKNFQDCSPLARSILFYILG